MGFDMVGFSGGKGLRGPQSAGLLLGKRKYIEAARMHTPPRGETIGRGMKVNKEEVLGMMVALELYLKKDHDKEWKLWEDQIELISSSALAVDGVCEQKFTCPSTPITSLVYESDGMRARSKLHADEARRQLREGHPSIQTVGNTSPQ